MASYLKRVKNLKRKVEELTFADTETTKLPKSSTAETPEGQIIERSVTSVNHHSHSAANNPDSTWHHCFTQIYRDLRDYDKNVTEYENSMDNDAPNLEQQLYLLTKDQVKSLLTAKAPDWLLKNLQSQYSSIPEAAGESEGGIIFFGFYLTGSIQKN
ncbi:hypothetical protein [Endozoicomonas sp. ONNA2]|uniref:hypothetical protein n=1 Tax=Endozoicomonas sp. ONNA2 TaxID=2828741 RepID=UPI002148913A|nr:hypothetical protein [Endozoicomonas sp. ONNA2]